MYNNRRLIVAQKDLLISIFNEMRKDYNSYRELVNKHDGVFKLLAAWMFARDAEEAAVLDVKNHLTEYINNSKLNPRDINVSKKSVSIGNNSFDELIAFIDFVHGNFPIVKKQEVVENMETDMVPVLTGDGIKIYKVNSANDSRKLASDTSWCIAYPGSNNMWQSYRSNQASTFFIIFDENPPNPNQRKVALDYTNRGILITDIPNRTGKNLSNEISFEYNGRSISGKDIPTYLKYLESKGVDLESTIVNPETQQEEKILQNKPVSDEENLVAELFKYVRKNKDLTPEDINSWMTGTFEIKAPNNVNIEKRDYPPDTYDFFSNNKNHIFLLEIPDKFVKNSSSTSITIQSEDVKTYLSKFIGLGWILPDNIFEYLFETPGGEKYLIQYVNTGFKLPETQIEKLKTEKQLFNSYVKQQITAWSMGNNKGEIFNHVSPDDSNTRKYILKSVAKSGRIDIVPKEWINNIPQLYLLWASPKNDFKFDDPLSKKIAIAKGLFKVYQKEPTLENTKILLHVPESIESLKVEAIANDYHEKLLDPPFTFLDFSSIWNYVPEKFHNYPEFLIYKNAHDIYVNGNSYFRDINGTKEPEINDENLNRALLYSVIHYNQDNVFFKSSEFWKYYFENVDNIFTGPFKRIYFDEKDQKEIIDSILNRMRAKFLKDPYILEKFLEKRGRKNLVAKLMSDENDEELLSMATNYLENFDELNNIYFQKYKSFKNIIFQKLFEKATTWPKDNQMMLFQYTTLIEIANFLEWYPESRSKINYVWLARKFYEKGKDLRAFYKPGTQLLPDEYFMKYVQYIPDFFKTIPNFINRIVWSELQYKYLVENNLVENNLVENNLIDNFNAEETEETQIEEQVYTTAYVKTIVKIAAKMDSKKQYKIADYITNLLSNKIKI